MYLHHCYLRHHNRARFQCLQYKRKFYQDDDGFSNDEDEEERGEEAEATSQDDEEGGDVDEEDIDVDVNITNVEEYSSHSPIRLFWIKIYKRVIRRRRPRRGSTGTGTDTSYFIM